jgi:hypothetical protein
MITAVMVLAVGLAGLSVVSCITDERSFVIAATIPLDDLTSCQHSIQDETDFLYQASGLLDLNFGPFNGRPSYSMVVQIHNYMVNNAAEGSERVNSRDVFLERFDVTYEWLTNRELLVLPEYQSLAIIENQDVKAYTSGLVFAGDGFDSPGKLLAAFVAIPPDVGTSLVTITQSGVQDWVLGVKAKAIGHTRGGARIESNEFLFPVYFCWGCDGCPADTATTDYTYYSCTPGQDLNFFCEEEDLTT